MLATPVVKDLNYDKVYEPAEDSFLLLDCFEEQSLYLKSRFSSNVPVVVEIGSGSGIVTTFLHQHILPESVYIATDVNPHACETVLKTAKDNSATNYLVDSCQMDLTTAVRKQEVDVLVFNPPYVPAEEVPKVPETSEDSTWLDLALLGGPDGMIITWKVLHSLDTILSPKGAAYILFCARNKPDEVAEKMRALGWDCEVVIHRKAGWEVLSVIRFTRAEAK
ncbi:putative methylase [Suhomyces tanzawaensis NRRL Y-17324]|uniref:Putative methylase n=1 Tax=Suhomyces tanzawaensis NRRL Y-17324 TaxID=984487 RepID=A0A1E4SNU6_9ASCO|nr:putative methylase [Suhomyces tanzawaensis NRRL Y-17324]ODV81062.1 putative methylase [Suhomyces tanzawaensis NRRL Y-17324]